MNDNVAVFHLQLACKNICIGLVADCDKNASDIYIACAAILGGGYPHTCNTGIIPQYFLQSMVPEDPYLAFGFPREQLILKYFFRSQGIPAVNQGNPGSYVR